MPDLDDEGLGEDACVRQRTGGVCARGLGNLFSIVSRRFLRYDILRSRALVSMHHRGVFLFTSVAGDLFVAILDVV